MKTLLLGLLMGFVGSALAQPTLTVVTSIHPYYALLQEVAGDHAEVIRLLPPGASPHTYDPTPRDVAQLADADFVVLNGVLDSWLLDLVEASGADANVFEVLSAIEFESIAGEEDEGEAVNPHIWLDPSLMMEAVPLFVDRLAELDPENADAYRANGEKVIAELGALDGELQTKLESIQGASFVPFHDAWPYFARHFGLDLIVEIEPAPGREPSPAYIADALEKISGSGAKAIFSEVQLPARPAEVVAESAGLPLYLLDPLGGTAETETYADLLRTNANTVLEALGSE